MNSHNIIIEIKSIITSDIDDDRGPQSNDEVYFPIEMEIGLKGDNKADLFQVMITTPEALLKRSSKEFKVIDERSIIIISRYD